MSFASLKELLSYPEAPVDFLYELYRPGIVPLLLYLGLGDVIHVGSFSLAEDLSLDCHDSTQQAEWKRWVQVGTGLFLWSMASIFALTRLSPKVAESLFAIAVTIEICVARWVQESMLEFMVVSNTTLFYVMAFGNLGIRRLVMAPCCAAIFANIVASDVAMGLHPISAWSNRPGYLVLFFLVARSRHLRFKSVFDAQSSLVAEQEATQALVAMICDAVFWVAPNGDEILRSDSRLDELMGCSMLGRRLSDYMPSEEKTRFWSTTASSSSVRDRTLDPVSLLPSTLCGRQGALVKADIFIVDRRGSLPVTCEAQQWGFLMGVRVSSSSTAPLPLNQEVQEWAGHPYAPVHEDISPLNVSIPGTEHGSVPDTLRSVYLREPQMHACSREELEAAILEGACHMSFPPVQCPQAQQTLLTTLALLYESAAGGALVCIADAEAFKQVFGDDQLNASRACPALKSSDGGYMTDRLRGIHVSDACFAAAFRDFTRHSDDDRWPEDHVDARARGRPKDGAILLSKSGYTMKCAVKLLGLSPAAAWNNVGTKHEAAMSCAWAVLGSFVFVRSDSGSLHLLLRLGQSLHVFALQRDP
mmetsp:Transcript_122479/g.305859  ORF Transcript_122479/g.305859 Transcript_122479/m.305859 type:complete len:588 (-) Transcript_122479:30-1793(-)